MPTGGLLLAKPESLTMTGMTEPQLRHSWEDQGYSIHMTVAIVAGATYHFCPSNEEIPAPAPLAPALS